MYSRAPLFFALFSCSSLTTNPVDVARDCRSEDANQRPRCRILFSSPYSDFFFSLGRRPDGSEGERELSETFVGPTKCNEPVLSFSGNPRMKFPLSTEGVVRMRACGGMAAFFFCVVRYGNFCELGPRAKWDGEESLHAHEEGGIERNHSVPPSTVSHFPVLLFRSRRNSATGGWSIPQPILCVIFAWERCGTVSCYVRRTTNPCSFRRLRT